jgi:hypothetical protein
MLLSGRAFKSILGVWEKEGEFPMWDGTWDGTFVLKLLGKMGQPIQEKARPGDFGEIAVGNSKVWSGMVSRWQWRRGHTRSHLEHGS